MEERYPVDAVALGPKMVERLPQAFLLRSIMASFGFCSRVVLDDRAVDYLGFGSEMRFAEPWKVCIDPNSRNEDGGLYTRVIWQSPRGDREVAMTYKPWAQSFLSGPAVLGYYHKAGDHLSEQDGGLDWHWFFSLAEKKNRGVFSGNGKSWRVEFSLTSMDSFTPIMTFDPTFENSQVLSQLTLSFPFVELLRN